MLDKFKEKHPRLHKHLFTVTKFSKYLALSMFVTFPMIGFYLGMNYQKKMDSTKISNLNPQLFNYVKPGVSPIMSPTPTLSQQYSYCNDDPSCSNEIHIASNWISYTNAENRFSFKYPDTWIEKNISQEKIEIDVPETPNCEHFCNNGGPMYINILENNENLPIDLFARKIIDTKYPDQDKRFNEYLIKAEERLVKNFNKTHPNNPIFGIGITGACGGDNYFIKNGTKVIDMEFNCMDYYVPTILSTLEFK